MLRVVSANDHRDLWCETASHTNARWIAKALAAYASEPDTSAPKHYAVLRGDDVVFSTDAETKGRPT